MAIYFALFFLAAAHAAPLPACADTLPSAQGSSADLEQQIKIKQDAIAQLESQITIYTQSIAVKQKESLSLANQLAIVDAQINKAELDLQLVTEQIDQLELEIQELTGDIQMKNDTILREQNMLAELVRAIHNEDKKNYIDILLSEPSFSQFFNQLFYLNELDSELDQSVRAIQKARDDVQAQHDVTARKQELLKALQASLEQKRDALDDQKKAKEFLLRDTKSSESKFRTMLAQLRSDYARTDQEVAALNKSLRDKLLARGDVNENGVLILSWPTPSRTIFTLFHDPTYPFRYLFEHPGIDIRAPLGTPVEAAAPGYVGWARTSKFYGNNVMIVHRDNISTLYAHLSRFNTAEGDYVKRGDIIGWSGGVPGMQGAGLSTGAHLHFEVRENGLPVDPLGFLIR